MTDPLEQKARETARKIQSRAKDEEDLLSDAELQAIILTVLKSVAASPICADCKTPLSHDHEGYWCEPCRCKAAEEYNAMQKDLEKANTPFEDADPDIQVYRSNKGWFEYKLNSGSTTAPFATWREAYRAAEAHKASAKLATLRAANDALTREVYDLKHQLILSIS